ncbi:hypothetical protein HZZ00_29275 [Streptomyces sp. NEAU-sy36]|uniref:hypothetical protein n=1 Tax=unclassified Streptomyces TaxID=2593676 RepID=UPI0015D612A5|nr:MULTISPECIES: hypothetical protein [unclassified Streptomyces]QLJ04697.1 hypothetical protein HZZ00_29275 [Streptomyces sp. NEAU-sy36]
MGTGHGEGAGLAQETPGGTPPGRGRGLGEVRQGGRGGGIVIRPAVPYPARRSRW